MKIGDVYPTRDGREATVTHITGIGEHATAVIELQNPESHCIFVKTGRANYPAGSDRPYDLILPPKTVKQHRIVTVEGSKEAVDRYAQDARFGRSEWEQRYGVKISVTEKFL